MKTTTFASNTRRAEIVDQGALGSYIVNLYGGATLIKWQLSDSWSQAVRVARTWVGSQGRVIA